MTSAMPRAACTAFLAKSRPERGDHRDRGEHPEADGFGGGGHGLAPSLVSAAVGSDECTRS